ncbi:MAG: nuclear transport factor 2 family protein [Pseudonocardiales bacterium]|nr:nuclear transport factor 2 family protein [Pseudonocardiales bacterium]
MTELDLETRVANLEAKEEVRAFIATYCAACDKMTETEALADLFWDNAVLRNPAGTHDGRQAIFNYYNGFFNGEGKFSRHHVLNQVITILEPDVARHEAYFVAIQGRDGESKIVYGHYDDVVVRDNGEWRFRDKVNDIVGATSLEAGWAEGFGNHVAIVGAGAR